MTSDRFCSYCGATNRTSSNFCVVCGQALDTATSARAGLLDQATILKNRYQIAGKIGQGGFGAVYLAKDLHLQTANRAVKEMSDASLNAQERQEAITAFQQEAALLARLMHPNLPRIYDHFEEQKRWYLVMDYIEGETLETILSHAPDGKLPLEQVIHYALQLCTVLTYLHTQIPPIIFRDLKPANVMITRDKHLYLIDFGIARLFKAGQTKDTTALGSPGYAAPEQYGKAQTTVRADIYSLGATLHHLLSGRNPGDDPFTFPLLRLEPHGPRARVLAELIAQMVSVEKEKRPASVQEVKKALQHLPVTQAVPSSKTTLPQSSTASSPLSAPAKQRTAVLSTPSIIPPFYDRPAPVRFSLHTQAVETVAWSADGKLIASGSKDHLFVWDATTGKVHFSHEYPVETLSWSPDDKYIVGGSLIYYMLFDASTGEKLFPIDSISKVVVWSPNGEYIAATDLVASKPANPVKIWAYRHRKVVQTFNGHTGSITALAWSPDSQYVLSVGQDRSMRIWDVASKEAVEQPIFFGQRENPPLSYYAAAWSPDNKYFAVGGATNIVEVWDALAYKCVHTLSGHESLISGLAWHPCGRFLAAASWDKNVSIWDSSTGEQIDRYSGHSKKVLAVAWSPDGKRIASASEDRQVHIWRTQVPASMPSQSSSVLNKTSSLQTSNASSNIKCPPHRSFLRRWFP